MKAKKGQGKKKEKGRSASGGGGVNKKGKPIGNRNQNSFGEAQRPQKKSRAGGRKTEWDLDPSEEECLTEEQFDIENLLAFEEILVHDVVTNQDGTKELISEENAEQNGAEETKKRKSVEKADLDDAYDEGPEDAVTSEKAKTKRRKKEPKSEVNVEGATEVIFTSVGPVVVEEVEERNQSLEDQDPTSGQKVKAEKKRRGKKERQAKRSQKTEKPQKNGNKRGNKVKEEKEDKVKESDEEENDEFEEQEWVKLGVPDVIVRSLKAKRFNKPTNIQALTLPAAILGKKDVVGAAETGSGKTLAFAIPIIDGILKGRESYAADKDEDEEGKNVGNDEHSLKALILTPTRELAVQIKNHFDVAAKNTSVKTVVIVGGLAAQKQERLLRSQPDVVIATPGRLWELLQQGDPHLSTVNQIKYLAIDETDRMVEKGHFQELEGILSRINTEQVCKDNRQNFVFSATLAFTHEPPQRLKKIGNKKVKFLQKQPKKLASKDKLKQIMDMVGVRPNPKIVDITTSKGTCETLTEMQITCSQDHKDYYLYYFLLCNPGRTIVFCNSINCVRRLTNLFFLLQCGEALPLHSEMHQKQRLRNLERFTANEKGVLIATDVAARGLDIQNIQHVIHYQVPKTAESYIHRSGRTARAFKGGIAILMVEPSETTTVKNIFRSLGRDEMLSSYNVIEKKFQDIKSTVEMAIKVEQFEHSVRKQLADHSWMEKAKKDMDLASSSDESDDEQHGGATTQKKSLMKSKKQLEKYKMQLSQMLINNNALTMSTLGST